MNAAILWKGKAKKCFAFLIFLSLWLMVPSSWAAYEVNTVDITANVLINTPTKWAEDLQVDWKAPAMGSDLLNGYFYKWNSSAASLNADDVLYTSFSSAVDGTVDPLLNPPYVVKVKADLADLDSGDVLYLHIMTWYTAATGARVSADVVYGPFLIDNVAPAGTVRIVDGAGNDIPSTSDTLLNLKLAAAKDPATMYLSESAVKPVTGVAYNGETAWELIDPNPGTKTIYVWFEDAVGNISSTPATDSVTLLTSTSISPNTATLDLAGTATQVFRVEGTDATYNWSIIQTGTVAQFSGASTNTNSVTVQGVAVGNFTLQADPTAGGTTLTTGTITVVQTVKPGDVNNDGDITLTDVKLAFGFFLGAASTSQEFAAANVYDDLDGNTSISLHDVKGVFTLFLGGTL